MATIKIRLKNLPVEGRTIVDKVYHNGEVVEMTEPQAKAYKRDGVGEEVTERSRSESEEPKEVKTPKANKSKKEV